MLAGEYWGEVEVTRKQAARRGMLVGVFQRRNLHSRHVRGGPHWSENGNVVWAIMIIGQGVIQTEPLRVVKACVGFWLNG